MSVFNKPFGTTDSDGVRPDHHQAAKELTVSKLFSEVKLTEPSYGLHLFSDAAATKQDLTIMHIYDDLRSITVELIDRDDQVFVAFKWRLDAGGHSFTRTDSAGSVELPVLDRRRIAKHRFLIQQDGREAQYRHLLKLNWAPASAIPRAAGTSFESEHNGRITGGRTKGEFFVGDAARHELLVEQIGNRGFAFARDLTIKADGVFLHARFAPPGMQFWIGQRLSAIIIQSRKGLQARSIQAA